MSDVTNKEVPEKPSDFLSIKVNKEDKEVFMSGGLIRNLVPYYMDFQSVAEIFNQPIIQNEIIIQTLKARSVRGAPIETVTIDDFDMSMEDTNRLIAWVTEHVLFYFIESVTTAHKLGQRNEPALKKLEALILSMASTNGSQDSISEKPSAGLSDASQAK